MQIQLQYYICNKINRLNLINIHAITSALRFYLQADTYYRVHSPFVFELLENTLEDNRDYYVFDKLNALRNELYKNKTKIQITDLGAGSKKSNNPRRSIQSIAKTAVSPIYQIKLLFKLVKELKVERTIELGTSLGISAISLAAYAQKNQVHTLEGSPSILELAKVNFDIFEAKNIHTYLGHFDQQLPYALTNVEQVDLCYIDGNHAKAPTIKYFEMCLPHTHKDTVIIFDDIYWSNEMTEAWQIIKNHKSVKLTLDLYYFGLVFFNPDFKEIQHFKILASKLKPWQRYF